MKNKKIKKEETLKNIGKLSKKDTALIGKLFSEYIGFREIREDDISLLSKALSMKYGYDATSFIISVASDSKDVKENEKLLKKQNNEVYELLQELKVLYAPKILDLFIKERWSKALSKFYGQTTIEPETKEAVHNITLHRHDGKSMNMYQPFSATILLQIGIFVLLNSSIKEMMDSGFQVKIFEKDLIDIEENILKFKKYAKKFKIFK